MELWIYASSLAPFSTFKYVIWQTVKTLEEMPHDASFHEDPHCLLVPRRSFERQKGIGMLRPVRLRIYAYAHLNVRYIDYNSVASYEIWQYAICRFCLRC